jgi:enamine deaminase RidA (YjgF/YER057c/UK114 family)
LTPTSRRPTKTCFTLERLLAWYDALPASPAVRAGDLVYVGGQVGVDLADDAPAARDVRDQARKAFDATRELVEVAGGEIDDVVEVMSFHRDIRDIDAVFDIARDVFRDDYPAWTAVAMVGSYRSDVEVVIRAIAHVGDGEKKCYTPDTPGWSRDLPVSAGCEKGGLVFVSGQVGADVNGHLVSAGDHAAQSRFAFRRIREIVEQLGGSLADLVDLLSFHHDPRGMVPCGDVQSAAFADIPLTEAPAWTAIAVPALPQFGALVCLRAIADLSPGRRIAMTPASVWWKVLPISGGTKKESGSLIAVSGEVASDGDGLVIAPGDTAAQARCALDRIREVLEMFDASMDDVVEIISFHKDPRAWEIVMGVARDYFDGEAGPAWTPVGCTGLWQEGYLHEIYAAAVVAS